MKELAERVATLEAALEFSKEVSAAQQKIIFSTLQVLHEEKKLPIQLVIQHLQTSTAFAQGAFDSKESEVLRVLIQSLKQIQEAYAQSGRIGR